MMLKTQDSNTILSKFNNSPNVHKYSTTTTTTFITNSPTGIIFTPNHQQHVFKTSSTTINMKSFRFNKPQLHYSSIFHKNTTHQHNDFWTYEFIINNIQTRIQSLKFKKSLISIITYEKWVEKGLCLKTSPLTSTLRQLGPKLHFSSNSSPLYVLLFNPFSSLFSPLAS